MTNIPIETATHFTLERTITESYLVAHTNVVVCTDLQVAVAQVYQNIV